MDIRDVLAKANQKFGAVAEYVTEKFEQASFGLQEEVAGIVTNLIERGLKGELGGYISGTFTLKDGSTVHGQSAFDRLVREDKDIYALLEKFRPSKLRYIRQARKIRDYIQWDNQRFAVMMEDYLDEQGIECGSDGFEYLLRTVERFRRQIYS